MLLYARKYNYKSDNGYYKSDNLLNIEPIKYLNQIVDINCTNNHKNKYMHCTTRKSNNNGINIREINYNIKCTCIGSHFGVDIGSL